MFANDIYHVSRCMTTVTSSLMIDKIFPRWTKTSFVRGVAMIDRIPPEPTLVGLNEFKYIVPLA